jgi:predicted RNA-binding protein YlqC (UPF0109 family)
MSSFDDEFGLFGGTTEEEAERRPALGARRIAAGEAITGHIEPEEERPQRERRPSASRAPRSYGRRPKSSDPWESQRRATALLDFLAKKLVQKPEEANVELFVDEEGKPVIELVVDNDDLGKVIGRSGRVAQALRTIVRATAEDRVSVDILDKEEAAAYDEGTEDESS